MKCLANRQQNDLIQLSHYSSCLTIAKAKEGTALAILKKQDISTAVKCVSDAILWLQESLNINSPMKDNQIIDAAITLINTYYWLRLEEIILILSRIKTGKTGKLYHAFDVQVFCSIIEDYLSSSEVCEYHEKKANEYKKSEKEIFEMPEESRKRFEKIYESIKNETPTIEIEEPLKDDNGRCILIRHSEYCSNLKELIPLMTDEEMKELRRSYVNINYRDGMQLIDKAMQSKIE